MKNVFLIASSSLLANKIIPVFERDDNVRLTVLLHVDGAQNRIAVGADTNVLIVPGGKGYRLRSFMRFLSQQKGAQFDEVIVLYNNKTGYGYVNVDFYALAINAGKRYALNYDHDEIPLTARYIMGKMFRALTGLCWHVVNTIFLCVILAFIVSSMVIVDILVCGRSLLLKKQAPL